MVDDRDVLGAEALDEVLRPPTEPGAAADLAVHERSSAVTALDELLAAEHALELVAALRIVEHGDPRVRRVARNLLDAQVLVGDARDLRQVGDRQDLRAPGEPAQDVGDRCAVTPPTAGVDLVEAPSSRRRATAAMASAMRESSPPEAVSATGASGSPAFGRTRKTTSSRARRPGLALAQLDVELALPQAEIGELVRDRRRERARRASRGHPRARVRAPSNRACAASRSARARVERVAGRAHVLELGQRRRRALEQLVEARAREAPLRVRDPVEPLLDLSSTGGLGVERVERSVAASLPTSREADDEVAQLAGRAPGARARGARAARARARRLRRGRGAPSPSSGSIADTAASAPSPSSATCRMPLAFRAERLLLARLEALGVLDEQRAARRAAPRSVPAPRSSSSSRRVAAASARQASRASPRRTRCSGPTKASSRSSWWDGRASRRCSNWPDIASSRSVAADEVVAGDAATPRVRPGAPVGEDAPGDHEAGLVVGPKLAGAARAPPRRRTPPATSSSASTYASAPAAPTEAASPFAPSRSPIACVRIVLPAPVSPVSASSPGASSRSASRIRTRFSIRSRRSTERS